MAPNAASSEQAQRLACACPKETYPPIDDLPTLLPRQPMRHKSLKVNLGLASTGATSSSSVAAILQSPAKTHKAAAKERGAVNTTEPPPATSCDPKRAKSVRFDEAPEEIHRSAATMHEEPQDGDSALSRQVLRHKSLKVNIGVEPTANIAIVFRRA